MNKLNNEKGNFFKIEIVAIGKNDKIAVKLMNQLSAGIYQYFKIIYPVLVFLIPLALYCNT